MASTFERSSEIAFSHYVYRLYAVSGQLLYVGVTNNINRRLRQHAKRSPWWAEVDEVTVHVTKGRAAAHAEEVVAIRDESPLHNIHPGQGSAWHRRSPADPSRQIVALRLAEDEAQPLQEVAVRDYGGNLSEAIRALLREALNDRETAAVLASDDRESVRAIAEQTVGVSG